MHRKKLTLLVALATLAACETDPAPTNNTTIPTPQPEPEPIPLPDVAPPGPFVADASHYPINEACYPSCEDSIINRWRPHFQALGFSIGHADSGMDRGANGALGHVYEWWAANRCGGYVSRHIELQPVPSENGSQYAYMRADVMHDPLSEPHVIALYRQAAALPRCPVQENGNEGLAGGS